MKLTCTRADLMPALSLASKAIAATNSSVPILCHVLLSSDDKSMGVYGTDLEVATTAEVPVECYVWGDVVLPLKPLLTFVKGLPKDAAISIETNDDETEATIRAGYREGSFKALPSSDFPNLFQFKHHAFQMQAADLHRLITDSPREKPGPLGRGGIAQPAKLASLAGTLNDSYIV